LFDETSGFALASGAPNTVTVSMNSTFKYWEVDGTLALTAEGLDTDKMNEMYKWEYQAIRGQRNDLLYKSDWTQIPGGPLSDEKKAEWATYRQQLRDLVIEGTCPLDFVWPVPPVA
jgi:Phage tail assembly chaperone protein